MAAHTDPLTGLPDREALRQALGSAVSAGKGVALAVLDVDHFMDLNEQFGHEVGDRVLRKLSEVVREAVPDGVYRVSGDEFAVVLPEATLEQAFLRLDQVRGRVQAAQDRFAVANGREVTITVGVAQCPRDAKDAVSLMSTADAALMAAKEGGRNQVALPPNEEMVMKSCYYSAGSVRKLRVLAERLGRKESLLLREALDDLLRRYDRPDPVLARMEAGEGQS